MSAPTGLDAPLLAHLGAPSGSCREATAPQSTVLAPCPLTPMCFRFRFSCRPGESAKPFPSRCPAPHATLCPEPERPKHSSPQARGARLARRAPLVTRALCFPLWSPHRNGSGRGLLARQLVPLPSCRPCRLPAVLLVAVGARLRHRHPPTSLPSRLDVVPSLELIKDEVAELTYGVWTSRLSPAMQSST